MADTSQIDFDIAAVKEAFLKRTFLISEDPIYDYYQTNSGMYPKNPGSGGGGGGGDVPSEEIQSLKNRMDAVEEKQADIAAIAQESIAVLSSPPYILSDNIEEVEDIIINQQLIRNSQEHFLSAF